MLVSVHVVRTSPIRIQCAACFPSRRIVVNPFRLSTVIIIHHNVHFLCRFCIIIIYACHSLCLVHLLYGFPDRQPGFFRGSSLFFLKPSNCWVHSIHPAILTHQIIMFGFVVFPHTRSVFVTFSFARLCK